MIATVLGGVTEQFVMSEANPFYINRVAPEISDVSAPTARVGLEEAAIEPVPAPAFDNPAVPYADEEPEVRMDASGAEEPDKRRRHSRDHALPQQNVNTSDDVHLASSDTFDEVDLDVSWNIQRTISNPFEEGLQHLQAVSRLSYVDGSADGVASGGLNQCS